MTPVDILRAHANVLKAEAERIDRQWQRDKTPELFRLWFRLCEAAMDAEVAADATSRANRVERKRQKRLEKQKRKDSV